jgi:hypothetical protein
MTCNKDINDINKVFLITLELVICSLLHNKEFGSSKLNVGFLIWVFKVNFVFLCVNLSIC